MRIWLLRAEMTKFDWLWGVVGIAVFALIWWMTSPPLPYTMVTVQDVRRNDAGTVFLDVEFNKGVGCEFVKLEAHGHLDAGGVQSLRWWDATTPDGHGDRLAGLQLLQIGVRVPIGIDQIEVRTRHDCEGEAVDRVMVVVDVPE